jgi:hypothetical protein
MHVKQALPASAEPRTQIGVRYDTGFQPYTPQAPIAAAWCAWSLAVS